MRLASTVATVAVAALSIAGCTADPGPSSVPLDELPARLVDADCVELVRCGLYATQDACRAHIDRGGALYVAAIAAGRITYDGEAMAICLAAREARGCDLTSEELRREPPACDAALIGTIPVGGACGFAGECTSDRCAIPPDGCPPAACCAGTCVAAPPEVGIGEPCGAQGSCGADAVCGPTLTCVALAAAGASCAQPWDCAYGLDCVASLCGAPARIGDACLPDDRCSDLGATCKGGRCVARAAVGGACDWFSQCQQDLECTGGTCTPMPALGQPCTGGCQDGYCNAANTCEAFAPDGGACTVGYQCASRNCAADGHCAAALVCI